jgi:micrococcal nuclease
MYEYRVNVVKVVDGDTVDVDIDLGFGVWLKDERVRIMGIDTPESRTSDKVEKKFGLAAKARLKSLLGKQAILKTQVDKSGEDMKGKFGRILGDFIGLDGRMVTEVMVAEGHCVPYFGGSKEEVQAHHMRNRERLIAEGIVKP